MIKSFLLLLIFVISSLGAVQKKDEKPLKVLVLIIASENKPVYKELYKIWRSYMHRFPDEVEAYFIQGDPLQRKKCLIKEDVVWSRTVESLVPGIINKTLMTLEFFMPRMQEFDYVLRTNLSSFYVFPRYMKFLKSLPRKKCYCGNPYGWAENSQLGWRFAHGAGITMSKDVAQFLVQNKGKIMAMPDYDDVIIGEFLKPLGFSLFSAPRTDFLSLDSWLKGEDNIPPNAFHFRVKNQNASLRTTDELFIHWELYNKFYEPI